MKSSSPSRVGTEETVAAVTDRGFGQDEHRINFSKLHNSFVVLTYSVFAVGLNWQFHLIHEETPRCVPTQGQNLFHPEGWFPGAGLGRTDGEEPEPVLNPRGLHLPDLSPSSGLVSLKIWDNLRDFSP